MKRVLSFVKSRRGCKLMLLWLIIIIETDLKKVGNIVEETQENLEESPTGKVRD